MNRIDQKFEHLRAAGRKAFIAYITAGYPDLSVTEALSARLEDAGVDILELGVPFSDPLADGPIIQAASFEALSRGVTLLKILDSVRAIRKQTQIPLALMTYYNPVFHFGEERFVREAKAAGVDGLIIPDLPVEEAGGLIRAAREAGLATVFFLAPTTTVDRMPGILEASTGFVYFVSVTGVTGSGVTVPEDIAKSISRARKLTRKPVCVGFGVSTPAQVKAFASISDGVIVGSAIIRQMTEHSQKPDMLDRVSAFVKQLSSSL